MYKFLCLKKFIFGFRQKKKVRFVVVSAVMLIIFLPLSLQSVFVVAVLYLFVLFVLVVSVVLVVIVVLFGILHTNHQVF